MAEYVRLHEVQQQEEECASCVRSTMIMRARLAEIEMRRKNLINDSTTPADIISYGQQHYGNQTSKCYHCLLRNRSLQ